jgi:hypothetical protein
MAPEESSLRYVKKRDIIIDYGLRREIDAVEKSHPRSYIKELE